MTQSKPLEQREYKIYRFNKIEVSFFLTWKPRNSGQGVEGELHGLHLCFQGGRSTPTITCASSKQERGQVQACFFIDKALSRSGVHHVCSHLLGQTLDRWSHWITAGPLKFNHYLVSNVLCQNLRGSITKRRWEKWRMHINYKFVPQIWNTHFSL